MPAELLAGIHLGNYWYAYVLGWNACDDVEITCLRVAVLLEVHVTRVDMVTGVLLKLFLLHV